ncbi:MAG: hypothetical protein ACLFQV_04220 [Vulcanimicrobiota bacterium]
MFWKQQNKKENMMEVSLHTLDDLTNLLKYWYCIEVDRWIDSEASKYKIKMLISGRKRNELDKLHTYYKQKVLQLEQTTSKREILNTSLQDYRNIEINLEKYKTQGNYEYFLSLERQLESCRQNQSIIGWFEPLLDANNLSSSIQLIMDFKSFGPHGPKNTLIFDLVILGENLVGVTGFKSTKRVFEKSNFLIDGLKVLKEFDERILEKHKEGKRNLSFNPTRPDWFVYECESEEEAIILNGLNQTLGNETYLKGEQVEFKTEEINIPGIFSYLKVGLPQEIFVLEE